jgi:chromate transport protein ChrA
MGIWGAVVAKLELLGPGCILIVAMVPFWTKVRHLACFKALLKVVNASTG